LGQSFLDPLKTDDGKPYGPTRYKEIVKECYVISKNINTSYDDVLNMTPTERLDILQFIADDIKRSNEAIEQMKAETEAKKQRKM
jgi:hypothetical protein